MSLVLAIEPERKHAAILRRLVDQQDGARLILVTSAYAAVVMINRQVPDLVLLGASLGPKQKEDVVAHFRSASDVPSPQTLHIPPFRGADAPLTGMGVEGMAIPGWEPCYVFVVRRLGAELCPWLRASRVQGIERRA